MNLSEIYQGAERLINHLIRREMIAQGHHLTGAMEDSLQGKTTKDTLEGFAVYYTKFVEEGVPASSASMKQFPFVVRYFQKRGLSLFIGLFIAGAIRTSFVFATIAYLVTGIIMGFVWMAVKLLEDK